MLYERYAKRRFQEGREEGREIERNERDKEWMAWLKRREEALAAGKKFDELPPSAKASNDSK